MGRKVFSVVAVVLGLGLVALSVTADAIGIGSNAYEFGWEQKLGVAVGMTAAWFAGLYLAGWYLVSERRYASTPATQSGQGAAGASA